MIVVVMVIVIPSTMSPAPKGGSQQPLLLRCLQVVSKSQSSEPFGRCPPVRSHSFGQATD